MDQNSQALRVLITRFLNGLPIGESRMDGWGDDLRGCVTDGYIDQALHDHNTTSILQVNSNKY